MSSPVALSQAAEPASTQVTAAAELRQLASQIKRGWREGTEEPDACAVLERYPALLADKSAVLDLAYEEFALRHEAGAPPDADAFCSALPAFRSSARRMLQVDGYVVANLDRLNAVEPIWPRPGQFFAGFQLTRELGEGAFARVFLAREPALGDRAVVVKVTRHGCSNEAETLGRLRHEHIVPVYSVRRDNKAGLTAICMPYLGGLTLHDLRRQMCPQSRPPARAEAIRAAAQAFAPPDGLAPTEPACWPTARSYVEGVLALVRPLAHALAYLHAQGVCHRDIKPSNVLIAADGKPYLLDFNLSSDRRRPADLWGGTPAYMAPELLAAADADMLTEEQRFGPQGDIYSFGMVLYELLAGRHPFPVPPRGLNPDDARQWLLERRRDGFPSLRRLNPQIDPLLERLVARCLALDPRQRPASAAELAAALDRLARPPVWLWRWATVHPRRAVAASAAVAVLAVGLGAGMAHPATEPAADGNPQVAVEAPQADKEPPMELGREAFRNGQFEPAANHFSRAIAADPKYAVAYYARGRSKLALALQTEDKEVAELTLMDAKSDMNQAYNLATKSGDQNRVKYALGSAFVHTKMKQFPDAVGLYLKIPEEQRSAAVLNNLGYCYLNQRRFDEAERSLNLALLAQPDLPAAHHNRINLILVQLAALDRGGRSWGQEKPELVAELVRFGAEALKKAPGLGTRLDYPEFHIRAASLAAQVARDPKYQREFYPLIWSHLNRAADQGLHDRSLLKVPPLQFWGKSGEAIEYLSRKAGKVSAPPYSPIVMPFTDETP